MIDIIVPIGKLSNPIIANTIATVLAQGCRFHKPYATTKSIKPTITYIAPTAVRIVPPMHFQTYSRLKASLLPLPMQRVLLIYTI